MENSKEILTELQEITPRLAQAGLSGVPFRIPAGYFADFPEILMIRIRLETGGYDEKTVSEISPLLSGLRNKTTYRVPEGFFENLRTGVPGTEKTVHDAPVVPLVHFLSSKATTTAPKRTPSLPLRIIRYAAAACIAGLIGITLFNITQHPNISDPIRDLSAISDQEMARYLDADDIHWTPGLGSPAETASVGFSDEDIHDLFKGVPDVELEQYVLALPEQKGTVN